MAIPVSKDNKYLIVRHSHDGVEQLVIKTIFLSLGASLLRGIERDESEYLLANNHLQQEYSVGDGLDIGHILNQSLRKQYSNSTLARTVSFPEYLVGRVLACDYSGSIASEPGFLDATYVHLPPREGFNHLGIFLSEGIDIQSCYSQCRHPHLLLREWGLPLFGQGFY